jgi:TolB-like protein/DNA-binding winged helix-turn-helix (wHTH) protein/Tfp pilus assembly protein PilF
VRKNGRPVTLTPRAFDVLIFLLENPGRVVEKGELFEQVWKDTFVSDNALTKIIKEIRHALEDSAELPRYIETVKKRGYRFIGEVEINSDQTDEKAEENPAARQPVEKEVTEAAVTGPSRALKKPAATAFSIAGLIVVLFFAAWLFFRQKSPEETPAPLRSIAVLPFKPLNADSRDESLEMGMAETLITRLGNLRQIAVRPISAVRNYTDLQQDAVKAGQTLQVEAVLEGSIQKSGERVRVTVRLIDIKTGAPLWAEQFDENFTDIFKVQDSIAERITNALTLQLSRQEKERLTKHFTDNPEAYQLYLRGQLLWHGRRPNWIRQSLAYYEQALDKDPNFALAHIGLADCYIMLSGHRQISMQEAEQKARPGILKALEIDDNLAEGHNALAELKYQYEYDWTTAENEFRKAVELNPNVAWIRQAFGWFLMSEGRFDEATAEMEKARALDPSSLTINVGRGRLFYYTRQYDEAIRHFQNMIAVEPRDASLHNSLYTIYEQKRMYPEAVESYLKFRSLAGDRPEIIEDYRETFRVAGWTGFLRKQLEAQEKNARKRAPNPSGLADVYARLGQKEEAFKWLEKSFEARDPAILQFKIEPVYDNLRDDPRYVELIRKIGLPP